MAQKKLPIRQAVRTTFRSMRLAFPSILLFEVIYKIITAVVIRPLISWIIQTMLSLSGHKLLFNLDILGFLKSPFGWIALILSVSIAAIAIYFEFAVIIIVAYSCYKGRRMTIRQAMKTALVTMKCLLNTGFIGFILYAMILLPFANNTMASSLIPDVEIPQFVTGELTKTLQGALGLLAGLLLVLFLAKKIMLVLPAMTLERVSFWKALQQAFRLTKGTGLRMSVLVTLFLVLYSVISFLPALAEEIILVYWQADSFIELSATYGISAGSLLYALLAVLSVFLNIIMAPMLIAVSVVLYGELGGAVNGDEAELEPINNFFAKFANFFPPRKKEPEKKHFLSRHARKIVLPVIAVFILLGCLGLIFILEYYTPPQSDYVVIGHRGSAKGVENTLGALQGAMDAGADYAEIDILLSADGIPMVIHDEHLKRLSGQDLHVYNLTAAELSQITLYQDGYEGKISTLEEVLQFCKGKLDLLIEFKEHGHEQENVVDKTIEIVRQEDFSDQVIFHTMITHCLEHAKTNYPEYQVGYIVFGNIGRLDTKSLRELDNDFLVVEEGMVSSTLIAEAEDGSMPIFVWTVNDAYDMEEYFKMGVSAIITDEPAAAMEVVDQLRIKIPSPNDDSSAA